MITLAKVMSTNLYTLKKNDTLQTARMLMLARHIHHVPVVNKDNHIIGLVSQRDILSASDSKLTEKSPEEKAAENNIRLAEIMTEEVFVMNHDDSLLDAAEHLLQNKSGCIPVVKDNVLVGIVTSFDFIRIAADKLAEE